MKLGIPISFTIHAVFLGGGVFLFNGTPSLPEDRAIIPIDIVSIAEETNVKAAIKRPKIQPEPEPDIQTAQTPLENAPEDAPEDKAANQETKTSPPPEDKPAEASPSQDATANDEAQEPEDTAKTEPKEAFNLDNLSALIDRSRDSQPEANQQKVLQSEETLYAFADVARRGAGAGDGLALSQIDALRAAMYKCWRIPADAKDPESLVIPVEVKLYRDGHLASAQLKNAGSIYGSSNPYMKIAADNALRAVTKCAPYDFLPAEKYDDWKQMTLTFRPILSQ